MHFFYDFESLESISFNGEKSVKESYGSKNYMKDIVCDDKDKLNKNKERFKNIKSLSNSLILIFLLLLLILLL